MATWRHGGRLSRTKPFGPKQRHSSPRHGGPLLELLSDAINAYLFGAHAAATAICRAVCEKALKEHYLHTPEYKDKKLGEVIFLAERKFEYLRGLKLKWFIDFANRVVHDYRGLDWERESDTVRDFFETAKTLIEGAPKR